ncbi:MAG: acyltransferase family protein [Verrucomicrobia bacterium]|nr:acyltransferase family protein [Verrucomicrobiota bacterium]
MREHYIDWLRVLGTGTVFVFHCARFFNPEDWHVKNPERSEAMGVLVGFLVQWLMPLFFILSAISIRHALNRKTNREYIVDRMCRLGVPLVFGVLVLIPPQVYIERVTHGGFAGSFIDFLPHYFDGWYGFGGNFAWMGLHLWYLEVLLILSLLTLPMFRWLTRPKSMAPIQWLANTIAKQGTVYALALPIAAIEMLVNLEPGGMGRRDFGGWSLLTYAVFFLVGFVIGCDRQFRCAVERERKVALGVGIAAAGLLYLLTSIGYSDRWWPLALLRAINSWSWLVAIMGFASVRLDFSSPFLVHANHAVLPFYVLHQTVIVTVAFLLIGWKAPIAAKYVVLAVGSFAVILALYQGAISRFRILLFLFGMR